MGIFNKVVKFSVYESYNNARKIADDIIESLISNTSFKNDENTPTYASSVRRDFWTFCAVNDDEISCYVIRIYKIAGNRKSRMSVSQNEKLK